MAERRGHGFACDLRGPVDGGVVEWMRFVHRLLDGIAINRCRRRENQSLDPLVSTRLQEVEGSRQVHVEAVSGMLMTVQEP